MSQVPTDLNSYDEKVDKKVLNDKKNQAKE